MKNNTDATRKASALAEIISARKSGKGYLAKCPAHGDRSPSLFFRDGEKTILFKCFSGCTSAEVVEALRSQGLWHSNTGVRWQAPRLSTAEAESEEAEKRKKQQKAIELWQRSKQIEPGDAAHEYLTVTRKLPLTDIPADLRFVDSLEYWHANDDDKPELVTKTPALLAAVRSLSGELLAVHRTYLSAEGGKFKPEAHNLPKNTPIKKVLGGIAGGAIQLHEPGDTLIVAEGLETALAAHCLTGFPAWAAVSSSNMAAVDVPESIATVYICIDNDDAGEGAGLALTEKLKEEGRRVMWYLPGELLPIKGADVADLILKGVDRNEA